MPTRMRRAERLKWISLGDLDLDPENPRLVVPKGATQFDLLEKLYEEEALDELVPSFLENGYFEEEPLVVVPKGDRYRTVEGNRRLACLKLLLNTKLRRRVGITDWPKPTASQRAQLEILPCVVYQQRAEVIPFLGFRHITGAKKWAPFQKARFVAQLMREGQSLNHIQEIIGDTTQATKKLYQDFVVYEQITEELGLPPAPVRERFSLLEVALGQRAIKRFLGMGRALPTTAVDRLVPEEHLEHLEEVTGWIFGSDDKKPVIAESRDISRTLAKVIENLDALEYLRLTGDLEGAYDRTDGEQQYLLRTMAKAERAIRDAAGLIALYRDDNEVRSAIARLTTLVEGLDRQIGE